MHGVELVYSAPFPSDFHMYDRATTVVSQKKNYAHNGERMTQIESVGLMRMSNIMTC